MQQHVGGVVCVCFAFAVLVVVLWQDSTPIKHKGLGSLVEDVPSLVEPSAVPTVGKKPWVPFNTGAFGSHHPPSQTPTPTQTQTPTPTQPHPQQTQPQTQPQHQSQTQQQPQQQTQQQPQQQTIENPHCCVSWRQTSACDAHNGQHEKEHDKTCADTILSAWSGYCECCGGRSTSHVGCNHEPFTCDEMCKIEHARATTTTAPPTTQVAAQERTSMGLKCHGWMQTAGCNPNGKSEGSLQSCSMVVSKGASGYCECEGKHKRGGVGCGHQEFTCAEVCASQTVIEVAGSMPFSANVECDGWIPTEGCGIGGKPKSNEHRSCSATILSDEAGFCVCSGLKKAETGCGHREFSCQSICSRESFITASALFKTPSTDKTKIPKIIHQTWRNSIIPEQFAEFVKSWLRVNPDWEYYFWNDDDNHELVRLHYPEYLSIYDGYSGWAQFVQRADIIRYFILHRYGGVYIDLDFEALRPLDAILEGHTCVLGTEPLAHSLLLYDLRVLACNAFMASAPGHPFWQTVFDTFKQRTGQADPPLSTGPRMLQSALEAFAKQPATNGDSQVFVLEPRVVFPTYDTMPQFPSKCRSVGGAAGELGDRKRKLCSELAETGFDNKPWESSFANHHWSHSWKGMVKEVRFVNLLAVVPGMTQWKTRVFGASPQSSQSTTIPQIIHLITPPVSNTPATDALVSWARLHPTWEIRLWDNSKLSSQKMPNNLAPLLQTPALPSQVAHLVACAVILREFGGLCAHVTTRALRPLNVLLGRELLLSLSGGDANEAYAALSSLPAQTSTPLKMLSAVLLGSGVAHALWDKVLKHISEDVERATPSDALASALTSLTPSASSVLFLPVDLHSDSFVQQGNAAQQNSANQNGVDVVSRLLGEWRRECKNKDWGV